MSRVKHKMICYECNVFIVQLEQSGHGKLSPALAAYVTQLRSNLSLLMDAWSVMAGRNIMNDILRILVAMEPDVSVSDKPLLLELKNTVTKALQSHAVNNPLYDSVLCLGYRVKTVETGRYTGQVDDWGDMKKRCDDMKAAIKAAYDLAAPYADPNLKVLKIFMAPEFFFRGSHGAYDYEDVEGVKGRKADASVAAVQGKDGIFDLMRQEIDNPIYKDWLFVLGTVVAAAKETRSICKICGSEVDFIVDRGKSNPVCKNDNSHNGGVDEVIVGARVDNIALVYKGGEFYPVAKELVSNQDFVDGKVNLWGEELAVLMNRQGGASDRSSKFSDERMGGSIFTIDGVTFGLEVCLDHSASVRSSTEGRLDHAANIQVQLIPSGGMHIRQFRALPNGIVFNVDGSQPHIEVVGPDGHNLEAHFDDWSSEYDVTKRKFFETLRSWKLDPKIVKAPDGSVLMYGPYELP